MLHSFACILDLRDQLLPALFWALCALIILLCDTGLVLEPLPTGAWAFLAVTVSIFTKTLSFTQAFTAFSNDVIWLIVVSFFFAAVKPFIYILLPVQLPAADIVET